MSQLWHTATFYKFYSLAHINDIKRATITKTKKFKSFESGEYMKTIIRERYFRIFE